MCADLTPAARAQLGWLLLRMRRDDLAAQMCGGEDHDINRQACRHTALARLGDAAGARDTGLTLMQQLGASARELAAVRDASPGQGYQRFLAWRVENFLKPDAPWFHRAQIEAEAGRTAQAMASLERAFAAREPALVKLRTTHEFAALRDSPRFAAILRAVGPV
jgi:hypothetical protein